MIVHQSEAEDLGPALAVEDALTVMVVILVLRMVLLVPMMSLDKARLERAEKGTIWEKAYAYVVGNKREDKDARQYEDAFDLNGNSVILTELGGGARILEAADANQNLMVVRHDVQKQTYYSMYIQKFSNVPSYSHGRMKWSPQEKKWFRLDNQIDYNQTPEAESLNRQYQEWINKRGLPN
ncbi:MAG: hypothetical protein JWP91_2069 [Fibrobacteres bacterium]|nr:hypothetical protein [Fibrobacterota bacterium]